MRITRRFRLATILAASCLAMPLTMGASYSMAGASVKALPGRDGPDIAHAGDWTTWQKDQHGTRYNGDEHQLTPANAGKLKLKWAFGYDKDAGDPHSQPAVVDGVVYFGAPGGVFYARDAKTGAAKWEFDTSSVTGGGFADIHDGPSVSGGKVYFGVGAYLVALDQSTGKLAWSNQLDTVMAAGITSSPIVFDGRVYVGVSSGENIMGKDHPCCTFRGHLDAVDAKSGKLDWRYYTVPEPKQDGTYPNGVPRYAPSGAGVWSSPAIDAKTHTVYVGTGQNYTGHGGHFDSLLALDTATGKERWTQGMTPSDTWRRECGSKDPQDLPYCPNLPKGTALDFDVTSPNLITVGGHELVGVGQKSGVYHMMDAHTGKVLWRRQLAKPRPNGGSSGIEWGGSFDGKRLYVATWMADPGTLFALDPLTGHVLWKTPNPADGCKTGGAAKYPKICKLGHTPAVTTTPGVVWEGSMDGKMRAYDASNGKVLWTYDTMQVVKAVNGQEAFGGSVSGGGGAVVSNGLVYVQTGYFFNPYPNDKGAALMVFGLN